MASTHNATVTSPLPRLPYVDVFIPVDVVFDEDPSNTFFPYFYTILPQIINFSSDKRESLRYVRKYEVQNGVYPDFLVLHFMHNVIRRKDNMGVKRGENMKRFAIAILVITLLFAFTLPALAQGQGQGKGLDNAPGQNKDKDKDQDRIVPVPEPNTLMLLLLIGPGLAVYAGIRRKKKKG